MCFLFLTSLKNHNCPKVDPCTFSILLKFDFLLLLFKHIIIFYIIHMHRLSTVYCKFRCQHTFIWHFAGPFNGGVLCRFGHADRVPSALFQNVQSSQEYVIYNIVYIFLLSTVSNLKPEKIFLQRYKTIRRNFNFLKKYTYNIWRFGFFNMSVKIINISQ